MQNHSDEILRDPEIQDRTIERRMISSVPASNEVYGEGSELKAKRTQRGAAGMGPMVRSP